MNPAILPFIVTLIAFILLLLVTISAPVVKDFYFLHADAGGGVRFGTWGWCIDNGGDCTNDDLGFRWGSQIIHWLTYLLVLYPIATGFTFLALLSLFPLIFTKGLRMYPSPMFSLLSLLSAIFSLLAFVFMIALFATALERFHDDDIGASFGPLPWMSLAATIILIVASVHSGCGTMFRGKRSPYVTYAPTTSYAYA